MYRHFLEDIVCPQTGEPLRLEDAVDDGDRIIEGTLKAYDHSYAISEGVPNFLGELEQGEKQVHHVFSEYWGRHALDYDVPEKSSMYFNTLKRLLLFDGISKKEAEEGIAKYLGSKQRILDAGCGSARMARFHRANDVQRWYCADFGESIYLAEKGLRGDRNSLATRASVFHLPFKQRFFDLIISVGVLHHTPNPQQAFTQLVGHLAPGGDICIEMIRRQVPIRDFSDAHIRKHTATLSYEENLAFAKSMYQLSKNLYDQHTKISVPAGLEFIGLDEGEYTLQKFVHTHIMKCFYNPGFSEEENIMQQIDWYTTKYAWPHTEEELIGWYEEAGLVNIQLWKPETPEVKNESIRIKGTLPDKVAHS